MVGKRGGSQTSKKSRGLAARQILWLDPPSRWVGGFLSGLEKKAVAGSNMACDPLGAEDPRGEVGREVPKGQELREALAAVLARVVVPWEVRPRPGGVERGGNGPGEQIGE